MAAEISNVILQTLGFSSYIAGQGTVITVGTERLDVEHACSGLGMLLAFGALCSAAAMMIQRPRGDKILILLSALPIAIIANVIRITLTGIIFAFGWRWLGEVIVHDLAGWLMMPIALVLIWLELRVIDWLFVTPIRIRKEDFIRQQFIVAQQEAPLVLGKPNHKRAGEEAPMTGPTPNPIPMPAGWQPGSNPIPMPAGRNPDPIPMPAGTPPVESP
jgi:exosortase/archaeosortase family protein